MYVPYGNLTTTGNLLQSVYDQLDVYRGQLVGNDGPSKSSYLPSPTASSNYLLLYNTVQQLAQKLSTAATSAVYNYTDITSSLPSSPYSTISPFSSPSSTVDDFLSYTSSSYSSSSTSSSLFPASPFTSSSSSFSSSSFITSSITSTTTSTTASSIWTTFMQSLPMPTDEATLVSELGLGPVRDPLYTAIPMTLLYVLILVTGVIGNLVTCVVIARNRYMHTATNYYLFSLAISDLLLLILGLPQEIQQIWRRYPYAFSEAFCILRGFSSEASTNSSVLTITAFTVERYVAICHPLRAHTMSKLSRAVKLIIIIWLLGFVCAAPIAYKFGIVFDYVHEEVLIPQSATCNVKRALPAFIDEHIFALQSLLVFVLPVTAISVLYVLIGLKLRQSSLSAKGDLNKLRRRPVKRLHSGDGSGNGNGSENGKKSGSTSALEKTATYFTSTSTESIENVTPPIVVKNGGGHKNGNGVAHHGHFNSNNHSNHRTLKEVANHFISQHHHQQMNGTMSQQSYIVHDHRQRGRLTKFTSSSSSASSGGGNGCGSSLSQRRQVIKMLTAVVVAFFVCFAPFHAQRLMAIYVKNPSSYEKVAFNTLTYISGVAYYLTATINPILYSIMSVRFRQAFHDTFVRTFCPSKSAIFQCTRQRTMSGMYNSMYYRASHPHIHHPLPTDAAGGSDRGRNGGFGSLGARSKSITAAAVIGAPINIVTHSIIKNVNGGSFGGGHQKSLAFAADRHQMPTTLFEEEEGGDLSSGERSEEIEDQVMRMNGRGEHHDSIGSEDLEAAWPSKSMDV